MTLGCTFGFIYGSGAYPCSGFYTSRGMFPDHPTSSRTAKQSGKNMTCTLIASGFAFAMTMHKIIPRTV
jgi:hypothetical protein